MPDVSTIHNPLEICNTSIENFPPFRSELSSTCHVHVPLIYLLLNIPTQIDPFFKLIPRESIAQESETISPRAVPDVKVLGPGCAPPCHRRVPRCQQMWLLRARRCGCSCTMNDPGTSRQHLKREKGGVKWVERGIETYSFPSTSASS